MSEDIKCIMAVGCAIFIIVLAVSVPIAIVNYHNDDLKHEETIKGFQAHREF